MSCDDHRILRMDVAVYLMMFLSRSVLLETLVTSFRNKAGQENRWIDEYN